MLVPLPPVHECMSNDTWLFRHAAGYTRSDIASVDFYEIGPRILSGDLWNSILKFISCPADALHQERTLVNKGLLHADETMTSCVIAA